MKCFDNYARCGNNYSLRHIFCILEYNIDNASGHASQLFKQIWMRLKSSCTFLHFYIFDFPTTDPKQEKGDISFEHLNFFNLKKKERKLQFRNIIKNTIQFK